ncbi:MAG: hypothetical protein K2X87_15605, partial [Gemmataceae bacterium]|nr:hypothetical protein [Gemmataceae bacterium]
MTHPTEVKGMTLRRLLPAALVVLAAGPASAASFTTTNFAVSAPTPELARTFGNKAEEYRKQKALDWLGREMPDWAQPCPLRVRVTQANPGGATTFTFGGSGGRGVVTSQEMEITGPVKELLHSVLPHEVTHTVLAYHFGRPVPRWADEGGSVLSENDQERFSHDVKNREYLNAGRGLRLGVLFRLAEYPRDMHVLYAEGYSICQYLVDRGGAGRDGRAKLLRFLEAGMRGNDPRAHGTPESWNAAVQQVYGFASVDALEEAWLDHLKNPQPRVAARNDGAAGVPTGGTRGDAYAAGPRSEVRTSAAPAVPVL